MKKILVLTVTVVILLSLGAVVFADSFESPADIFSRLKGITKDEAYELKGNKTFGDLAKENGVYDDFHKAYLESKKSVIEEKIRNGELTREQADEVLKALEECDGTSQKLLGQKYNLRFGQGQGLGQGNGKRQGQGFGQGKGKMGSRWQTNN